MPSAPDTHQPPDVAAGGPPERPQAGAAGALTVAAMASAGAGLVHAAAAGSHAGDRTVSLLFAVTAMAQVGWAALAVRRPTRTLALAGALVNAGAALAWVASRTVGLPAVDGLAGVQAVGLQDGAAATLGLLAAATAAATLLPRLPGRLVPASPAIAVGVAGVVVALAIPAMAGEHTHGDRDAADHDHRTSSAGEEAAAAAGHDHEADADGPAGGAEGAEGAGGAGGHAHEVPARLDHEPTDDQLEDARQLIAETEEGLAPYADLAAAEAAGYVSIGDSLTGVEHFINHDFLVNDTILDASEPESLVYQVLPDGGRRLTTAMYILPPGSTMDDVPDIAGNLTVWHNHDNLCWDATGTRLAGFVINGTCVPGGTRGLATPMLHVWVEPNDCGPFAGTDARQMTGSCVAPDAL